MLSDLGMNFTVLQKTNFDGFPKPGELIEVTGTHLLETSDRAILNTLLQRAHDSGKMAEDSEWELTFAELRKELSNHNSNERVRESLARLGSVRVAVHYISGKNEPRTLETPLLAFIDTSDSDSGTATVQYSFPKRLSVVLLRSNRWGRVRCEVAYAMRCKYAITLYELICLRINREKCVETFTLERFRELLGVPPGTYTLGSDFNRYVVQPALLEVNGLSDFGVAIELRRRHSRAPVHQVDMAWWQKEGDEFRTSLQERRRSKMGRKARLRGTVEPVTLE